MYSKPVYTQNQRRKCEGVNQRATLSKPRSGSKLAQFITHAVETGELKPGDKLCTETELAQKYSESVYAVRSALKELKAAGILYSVPKKGVFVCDKNAAEIVEKDNNSSEHNVIFSSRSFLPRQKDIYDKIAESFAETSLVSRMEAVYLAYNPLCEMPKGDIYEYSSMSFFYQQDDSKFVNLQKYFADTVNYRDCMIDSTGIPLNYTLPIVIYNKKVLQAAGFAEKPDFCDYTGQMEYLDEVTGAIACDGRFTMPGTNQNIILRLGRDFERIHRDICNKEISEKKFTEKYYDIIRRITAYWHKYHICYPKHEAEYHKNFSDGKSPFYFGLSSNYLHYIDNEDYGAAVMYSHDNTVNGVLTVLTIDNQSKNLFDAVRLARHFQKKEFQKDFARNGLYPLDNEAYSELPYDNAKNGLIISQSVFREYFYISMNIVNVELWNIVLFDKSIEDAIHDILVFSRSYIDMQLDSSIMMKQQQWADYYR